MKKQICMASGRWNPPHIGHIISLQRLAKKFEVIYVPVLDYNGRSYPAQYSAQVLREALDNSYGKFVVFVNKHHFAKITKNELKEYPRFDVYASGNLECLKHMENLGYKTIYYDRSFEYAATDQRLADGLKNLTKNV